MSAILRAIFVNELEWTAIRISCQSLELRGIPKTFSRSLRYQNIPSGGASDRKRTSAQMPGQSDLFPL